MTDKLVRYERKGKTAFIMLNRPSKHNAMNLEMSRQLDKAWWDFQNDENLWTAVIFGSGNSFCSGIDVKELGNDFVPSCPGISVNVDKPIIAAVSGYCLGQGFLITMYSDIRIASYDAKFGYPEGKAGSTAGGASSIVRHIPSAIAMEILLTGNYISANRAYEIGYINLLVQPEQLLHEAERIAEHINERAPLVNRALKKLVARSYYPTPREQAASYMSIIREPQNSEDAIEGRRAFLEKRKPDLRGR